LIFNEGYQFILMQLIIIFLIIYSRDEVFYFHMIDNQYLFVYHFIYDLHLRHNLKIKEFIICFMKLNRYMLLSLLNNYHLMHLLREMLALSHDMGCTFIFYAMMIIIGFLSLFLIQIAIY
jgi:hypothetical protein